MALTVVAAYDIADDRRRARVAAALQVLGNRIQRSVFLVTLDHDDLAELTARIKEIIDLDHDSVYLFRQCVSCWDTVDVLGQATVETPPLYWAIF